MEEILTSLRPVAVVSKYVLDYLDKRMSPGWSGIRQTIHNGAA
jgi:hypothetical protein